MLSGDRQISFEKVVQVHCPCGRYVFLDSCHWETGKLDGVGAKELGEMIFKKCLKEKVLIVSSDVFKANKTDTNDEVFFFKGTFAAVPLDKLEIGIQRLGKALDDIFDR
jgi:DNA-binding transcriptional MocR family regulator